MNTITDYKPPLKKLAMEIAEKHGISWSDMVGKSRTRRIALARKEYYWRARRETGKSYFQIGSVVNRIDHTTVLKGIKSFQKIIDNAHRIW